MFSIIKSEKNVRCNTMQGKSCKTLKKTQQAKDYMHEDVVCFKIYALNMDFFVTTKIC